ncbi:MAG: SdpI family protein [Ruminococcus sp.]|nr:SdpI family protein [Ruminococcus sp.]
MNNTAYKRLALILIAAAAVDLVAAGLFILTLPDTVPTHFGPDLVCDGTGSRWQGLIPPLILLILFPIGLAATRKSKNFEKNLKPLSVTLIIAEGFIIIVNWVLLFIMKTDAKLGDRIPLRSEWIFPALIGILFIVIGNYLPTVRQNGVLGIKLSWTLKNERCWNAVHRFSGKLYVAAGILCIGAAILINIVGASSLLFILLELVTITAAVIVPTVYAYSHRND